MKTDNLEIEILRQLVDGRKSFGKIAKELSVAENTVRSRVDRMVKSKMLRFSGVVNPEAIPGHRVVFFGVKTANTDLVNTAKEFSKLQGVISVSIVTGRFDLMVLTMLNDDYGLVPFVTEEVTKVKDVISTEAFVAYNSTGLMLPYVL
jgi:Lrp/AsnC family transcriptional regulator for asnA, asnC and gidA